MSRGTTFALVACAGLMLAACTPDKQQRVYQVPAVAKVSQADASMASERAGSLGAIPRPAPNSSKRMPRQLGKAAAGIVNGTWGLDDINVFVSDSSVDRPTTARRVTLSALAAVYDESLPSQPMVLAEIRSCAIKPSTNPTHEVTAANCETVNREPITVVASGETAGQLESFARGRGVALVVGNLIKVGDQVIFGIY